MERGASWAVQAHRRPQANALLDGHEAQRHGGNRHHHHREFEGALATDPAGAVAPAGGLGNVRWQFVLGIVLAATGGALVALYKPDSVAPAAPAAPIAATQQAGTPD